MMRSRVLVACAAIVVVAACSKSSSSTTSTTTSGAITYLASLASNKEVPPNTEVSYGSATFSLTGSILTYSVVVFNLTGNATASHIHVGSSSVAGGVIVPFTINAVPTGTVASGTIDLTAMPANATVSGDSLKALFNSGNAYVNVHTAAHSGGEIRGQVNKQ